MKLIEVTCPRHKGNLFIGSVPDKSVLRGISRLGDALWIWVTIDPTVPGSTRWRFQVIETNADQPPGLYIGTIDRQHVFKL